MQQPPTSPLSGSWIIVSDLDGTLLDHHTYSHEAADPLLATLETKHVPVILNSSKTRGEMLELREDFHNRHPFIVENGSAVYFPQDYFADPVEGAEQQANLQCLVMGSKREAILQFLRDDSVTNGKPYMNFADASVADIVAATGLSTQRAQQAQQRDFSEPLLWQGTDDEKQAFIQRVNAAGFNTLQGGRFLHVIGDSDKGRATARLLEEYRLQTGADMQLLAAGDSPNDIDMLSVAQVAVIIKSPTQAAPTIPGHDRVYYSTLEGPLGWREIIEPLLG